MILIIRFFIFTLMTSHVAYAGTKGLDVKLRNVGESDFYNTPIFKQYMNNRHSQDTDRCWQHYGDGISGIDYLNYGMFYLENGHQVNENTASEGYHGMYIIYPKNGYLTIMGVGANANPKKGLTGISPVIKDIKLDQSKPKEGAKIFERSLCRVSKPFNIGFGV